MWAWRGRPIGEQCRGLGVVGYEWFAVEFGVARQTGRLQVLARMSSSTAWQRHCSVLDENRDLCSALLPHRNADRNDYPTVARWLDADLITSTHTRGSPGRRRSLVDIHIVWRRRTNGKAMAPVTAIFGTIVALLSACQPVQAPDAAGASRKRPKPLLPKQLSGGDVDGERWPPGSTVRDPVGIVAVTVQGGDPRKTCPNRQSSTTA